MCPERCQEATCEKEDSEAAQSCCEDGQFSTWQWAEGNGRVGEQGREHPRCLGAFLTVYQGGSWSPYQEMEEDECFKKKGDLSLKYFE